MAFSEIRPRAVQKPDFWFSSIGTDGNLRLYQTVAGCLHICRAGHLTIGGDTDAKIARLLFLSVRVFFLRAPDGYGGFV